MQHPIWSGPKPTFGRVSSCKHQTHNCIDVTHMLRSVVRMARAVAHGESRKDASSNVRLSARSSSLRQPRLAQAVKNVLGIPGVLVDEKTFNSFNCVTRVNPQHVGGRFPGLLKLSQLTTGCCQP